MRPFFYLRTPAIVAFLIGACLCCASLVAVAAANDAGEIAGPATVTDGDTIRVAGERIRLFGIDAPELDQICANATGAPWFAGRDAAAWLRAYLGTRKVACHWDERDRFGRAIATCRLHGRSVNAALVREGWAIAYRKYSDRYVGEEAEARAGMVGIWGGQCLSPKEWRDQQ